MGHGWVHEFRPDVAYNAGGMVYADEAEYKHEAALALTSASSVTILFNDFDSTVAAQLVRPIRRLSHSVSDHLTLRGRAHLRRHR